MDNLLSFSTNHEWFFHDICLQYRSEYREEDLVMKPESDLTGAFAVTKNSNKTASGSAGLTAGHVPSANVSLSISRSNQLNVEYSVNTWCVSAHRVTSG
jgi:hypothetical protein